MVIVPSSDVFERDVVIDGLTSCTVHIPGVPSTVHVTNVHDVTILCGPVQTSVFIEHAAKCTFALACQQLRTHSTTGSLTSPPNRLTDFPFSIVHWRAVYL